MAKYTKRQYKKDLARAIAKREHAHTYYERINKFIADYLERHADSQKPEPPVIGNIWDRAYAANRACDEKISEIEDRYLRRNWTFSDYQFHELVVNNID